MQRQEEQAQGLRPCLELPVQMMVPWAQAKAWILPCSLRALWRQALLLQQEQQLLPDWPRRRQRNSMLRRTELLALQAMHQALLMVLLWQRRHQWAQMAGPSLRGMACMRSQVIRCRACRPAWCQPRHPHPQQLQQAQQQAVP